ncbi:hypothetical protein KKD19_00010 [Patescibacteria group bacterium]|nr:hypothetical protein [Patescibacteria group bacterium]
MNLKIKKKRYSFWVLLALLVLSSFFVGNFANAGLSNAVSGIVGHIVQFLVWILGGILFVLIYILVWIAQYNDFIHSGAVTIGWVLVRDLCNMFFILILLVIAFATILRIENYNVKKLLPKLLIMAVLINFSKTICGLIIDFAQVIMLTFVNGFKDMGSANLTSMLGIKDILAINADAPDVSLLSIVGSYFLALLYTIISVIVVLVIVAVLVMRIIMLWVYIVLSPLAFLLSAFPAGQKYASQWWSEFSKQVVVGPILAFFIWLSFVSIGTNNAGTILNTPKPGDTGNTTKLSSQPVAGLAEAGTPDNMIKFIISIGMLIGGLMVTQQLGGVVGSIAGKGMAAIQKGKGLAWKGAKAPFRGVADVGVGALSRWDGLKNTLARVGGSKVPLVRSLATQAHVGLGARQRFQEEKAQKYISNINDPRILARMANQTAITPWQRAMQKVARNKVPSTISDVGDRQRHLNEMSRENLGKLGDAEWHALGANNVNLTGRALSYIQKNSDERGAYNYGHQTAGRGTGSYAIGIDSRGNNLNPARSRLAYGNLPGHRTGAAAASPIPADPDEIARLTRTGRYANRYRKAEDETKARGAGNLSVGEFGREQTNTMAVDFDKLNLESLKESAGEKFEDIKGVNVTNPETIKQVADKMVSVLNSEISKLKLQGVSGKKVDNLEAAKERFKDPSKLDNISLVNSSSRGYNLSDLKKTKIHEEFHGFGIKDEADTEKLTQHTIDTKSYSKVRSMAKSGKSVDEIINSEKADDEEVNESRGASENLNNNPATGPIVKNIVSESAGVSPVFKDLVYLVRLLNKTIIAQTSSLGKMGKNIAEMTNINPEKTTPLEISVISEKIKNLD